MTPANRPAVIKTAMKMLVDTLREEDKVAIVVYAGRAVSRCPPPAATGRT